MKTNDNANPKPASMQGPMSQWVVAGAAGAGLWQTQSAYLPLWAAIGAIALMAVVAVVWLYRIRAARRFFSALDAYAVRESARAEERSHTPMEPEAALAQSND